MRSLIVMVAFGTALASVQTPVPIQEDAAVYEAILAARIRSEVDRFSGAVGIATPAPVLTLDRTVAMCLPGVGPPRHLGCVFEEDLQSVETKPPRRRRALFKGVLESASRRVLTRSFRSRNRESQPFPGARLPDLIVVSPQDFANATKSEAGRTLGVARFSLPAYAGDGRALVYGSYVCGGLCGYSWLFLLERQGDRWQVVATETLWIS